jgi:hypothetical protein
VVASVLPKAREAPSARARGGAGGGRGTGGGRGEAAAHFMKFDPPYCRSARPGPRDMDMDMGIWGIVTASR